MLKHKKNNKEQIQKDKNQRILHIYSSHLSVPELALHAPSLPLKKNTKNPHKSKPKLKEHSRKDKNRSHHESLKVRPP